MTEQLVDEVRRSVAAQLGLPEQAISFLAGETLAEIETSAAALAELLAARHRTDSDPGPELGQTDDPLTYAITNAPALKRQRQAALLAALHPEPPQQARDEQGKFAASSSGGFDGGARARLSPRPGDPVQDHNEAVVQLAQFSKLGHSGF
jgi:hypothetical protein